MNPLELAEVVVTYQGRIGFADNSLRFGDSRQIEEIDHFNHEYLTFPIQYQGSWHIHCILHTTLRIDRKQSVHQ